MNYFLFTLCAVSAAFQVSMSAWGWATYFGISAIYYAGMACIDEGREVKRDETRGTEEG